MTYKKNTKRRSVWFIDLDDTLHDAANGTLKNIDLAMSGAIQNLLGVDRNNAEYIRKKYWIKYGATVVGLKKIHNVQISEFLDLSHSPETLSDLIQCAHGFSSRVKILKGKKWLITNSPERYALQVLRHLKLNKCFEKVVSIEKMNGPGGLKPKPLLFQWRRLVRLAGVPADQITVVDDCLRNLKTAKLIGCETVWAQCFDNKFNTYQKRIHLPSFVDKKIKNLSALLRV